MVVPSWRIQSVDGAVSISQYSGIRACRGENRLHGWWWHRTWTCCTPSDLIATSFCWLRHRIWYDIGKMAPVQPQFGSRSSAKMNCKSKWTLALAKRHHLLKWQWPLHRGKMENWVGKQAWQREERRSSNSGSTFVVLVVFFCFYIGLAWWLVKSCIRIALASHCNIVSNVRCTPNTWRFYRNSIVGTPQTRFLEKVRLLPMLVVCLQGDISSIQNHVCS